MQKEGEVVIVFPNENNIVSPVFEIQIEREENISNWKKWWNLIR